MSRRPSGRVARVVAVPRTGGGVRWLTELTPAAAAAYVHSVGVFARAIEPQLGPRVVANRVAGAGVSLEPWPRAHTRWRRGMGAGMGHREVRAVLKADVRDCYASVSSRAIESQLRGRGVPLHEICTVLRLLERFGEEGVRGLPVGPDPSAVLANLVLQGVDDALGSIGARYLRWVDDIVVFARGRREAVASGDVVVRTLERLGLQLNERKSAVLTDRADACARICGTQISPAPVSRVR